nr:ASN_HP1_G0046670.mRNA.1.CDS.1 [Saccharomyces cerevisiae]
MFAVFNFSSDNTDFSVPDNRGLPTMFWQLCKLKWCFPHLATMGRKTLLVEVTSTFNINVTDLSKKSYADIFE